MIQVIFQTLFILTYFAIIFLFMPIRAWKKGRKKLSITFTIISAFSLTLIISYFTDDSIDDAGYVVLCTRDVLYYSVGNLCNI